MEDLIYRIFNRKIILRIDNKIYTIKAPSAEIRYQAELYKQELMNDHKYDLPLVDFYSNYLVQRGFIDADYETKIKNMNDTIKRLKVDLFNANLRIEESKKIRKNLNMMRDKLSIYFGRVEFYKRQTLEYFTDNLKNKFILINTTYLNNNLIFNVNDLDIVLLNNLVTTLNDLDISVTKFREIARSDVWRNYWLANKTNLFGIPAIEYSEDQKALCMFSRMYDNVYEHPEHPTDDIIADDDKLDGWMIIQNDKNNDEKKQQTITNLDPKYTDVFKPAESLEEAASIYQANTADGKRILKERAKVIKENTEVKDKQFRDVQLDILEKSSLAQTNFIKNIGKK